MKVMLPHLKTQNTNYIKKETQATLELRYYELLILFKNTLSYLKHNLFY